MRPPLARWLITESRQHKKRTKLTSRSRADQIKVDAEQSKDICVLVSGPDRPVVRDV